MDLFILLIVTLIYKDTSFCVKFITCIFVLWFLIFIPTILVIFSTWLLELFVHWSLLPRFNTNSCIIHVFFLWIFKSLICLFHDFEFLLCLIWFIMVRMELSCWITQNYYLFSKIVILILSDLLLALHQGFHNAI